MLFLILRMLTGVVAYWLLLAKPALRVLVGTGTLAMRMFARRKPPPAAKMVDVNPPVLAKKVRYCQSCAIGLGRKHCPECEALNRAEIWLWGRDRGVSSETIHSVLSGQPCHSGFGFGAPYDADDFGRCARLLELVPEWIPRLGEVADACPPFRRLVRCWPELTRLYERGDTAMLSTIIGDLRSRDDLPIRMTVRREWELVDAGPDGDKRKSRRTLQPGTHDMERIKNPFGHDGCWLVLKGTRLGASEGSWRQWAGYDQEWLITFDDDVPYPGESCRSRPRMHRSPEADYKVWKCTCGEPPVFTDSSDNSCECPGCGGPMENRPRSPHRHGWYSVENDKEMGHYFRTLATGGTVMVTNVTISPTGGLADWPDAVYAGEIVPPDEGGISHKVERFGGSWRPPWERKLCRSS